MRRTVVTVLAALLSAVAHSAAWNPYTALRPRHLLALYPLLHDFQDCAPSGSSATGYGQHGTGRAVDSASSNPNALEGTRLDRTSGIDLPLCIHQAVFPRLTMGAWVYTESIATQPACILSEDGLGVGRSICMHSGKWRVNGQREPRMDVTTGVWTFVAVVYDNAARSVSLFVDGVLLLLDSSVAYDSGGSRIYNASVVVGSGVNASNGFAGSIKSVFFYDEALNDHELRYLMTTKRKPLPLAIGRWGYAFEQTDDTYVFVSLEIADGVGNV
uniref:LamG-like jellyroll fold domain-containing protein n=1 Tax=Globisporangium ultimum (strain ATCC 200006 / CBS 805.95 / DAOM BR144) TaxID=431595 RepID=K3X6Q0_GLOUD